MKELVEFFSIEQVAERTPWSKTTLYRIAPEPDSPFHKRGGRWVTTEADLLEWVRTGPKPRKESISADPMPSAPRTTSFRSKVVDLHRRAS